MERDRTDGTNNDTIEKEGMVRDGRVLIDEEIVRGDGPVTYAGSVGNERAARPASAPLQAADATVGGNAVSAEPIPSMINDNTDAALETTGSMMADSAASQILSHVRTGMTVVDAAGEELGAVDYVRMGDPGAATVGADMPADPGFFEAIFAGQSEPDLPEPLLSRLLRLGFIKVDGEGWIDTDRYVTADFIDRVSGDKVILTADKNRILSDQA
ncbi:MAG: hypothetical protein M3Q03_11530 [Chloroflexota bacterium]|nr:hypothetical protein [Chloroflexota bacterium]